MLWRDIGYLMHEKNPAETDEMGRPVVSYSETKVFCNKKSVRQSEFYQAHAQGFRPELMFEVRSDEYHGETHFKYAGKVYRIIRTYDKNGEITEIICNSMVTGHANI